MHIINYFDMKKFLCAIALAFGLLACDDEAHIMIYEDMMYFLRNESNLESWSSPITKISTKPLTQVDLFVVRNAFAAQNHPQQTVRIIVDEEHSSAILGTDFSLDQQVLTFSKKNELQRPLCVTIHSLAAGKKIALRLDYEYYEECHLEGRKADRLTITVKNPTESLSSNSTTAR